MAYVGNTPSRGQWRKLTDISGSFNGVTTTFTTSVPPGTSDYYVTAGSASQLIISVGGVIQEPDVDYTVSTYSITFTTAPAAGLSFFGVLCGDALNVNTPADGSVTTAKLSSNLTVDLASGTAASPSLTFDSNTGLYSPGEDQVGIATGGTGRMFIDSSGRLLVGTSSTRSWSGVTSHIQLEGTDFNASSISQTLNSNNDNGAYLALNKSRGTSNGSQTVVQSGDQVGAIYFNGADGSSLRQAARIEAIVDGTPGAADMPGRLVFSTTADGAGVSTERMRITNNGTLRLGDGTTYYHTITGAGGNTALEITANAGQQNALTAGTIKFLNSDSGGAITERMRLDNNGRLLVGTSSTFSGTDAITYIQHSSSALSVYATSIYDNHVLLLRSGRAGSGFSARFVSFKRDNDTEVGTISGNGTSVSYNTSSDYRLKENVVAVSDGIVRLQQLKPSRFNFIADPAKTVDGFLAHEAAEVVPECVTGEKDAVDDEGNPVYQGIDQSKLVPLLTAALQEAVAKIESLEARLTAAGI